MAQNPDTKLLLSDTLVPDIFIQQYMGVLSSDGLKLYLWLLMTSRYEEFDLKAAMKYGLLNKAQTEDVLSELIGQSLVLRNNNETFQLINLKEVEALEFAKAYASRGVTLAGTELSSDEEERNSLAGSISNTFYAGKMPNWGYRLIDTCLFQYRFDTMVTYKVFEEGVNSKISRYANKMAKLAEDWYNHGYITLEKLESYFQKKSKVDEHISLLGRLLRVRIDGVDIELITKWIDAIDPSTDLVEYAYRTNKFRKTVSVKNVADTLMVWHEAGINSIDKAMLYEAERKDENISKNTRKRGTDNTELTGKEAGIEVKKNRQDSDKAIPAKPLKPSNSKTDGILDMFGDDDDND